MPNSTFEPFQSVLPGGIPNDYQHIDATPDMFGARSAEAEEKTGADAVSSGERITSADVTRQDLYNTLTANDMNTQGVAALTKIQDDFSQKTGKDAYDSYPAAQSQVLDAINGLVKTSPNLKTQVALSTSLKYYGDRINMSMRQYADSQLHDYTKQSYTDSAGVKADSFAAIYDKDPSAADALLQSGIDDYTHVAQLSGLDPTFQSQKYVGAVVGKAVQDQLANGLVSGAERLFQTYRDKMDVVSRLTTDKAFKTIHATDDAQAASQGKLISDDTQGTVSEPGFNPDKARTAIASIESSGGDFGALGPVTKSGDRAYGAYGVMGDNIPSWTKEVLGRSLTPSEFLADPQAQTEVFNTKFGQYVKQTGNANDAASMWFTGKTQAEGGKLSDATATTPGITGNEYVSRFSQAYNGGSPADNILVPQADAQKALNAKYANDPEALLTASRKLDDIYTNLRTANKTEIDQLSSNVPTMISSLSSGNMEFAPQVDEAIQKIQTYQPPHAAQMIQDLQISRKVGSAISGLRWESPDQLLGVSEDLNSNKGQISDFIAQNVTDPKKHAKLVTAAQKGLQSFIDQRVKELGSDPAKYVASHPTVSSAWDAYTKSPNLEGFQNAASISLNVQASLGVEHPHVFDARTAQQFADQITTGADPGKVMDKIQASTGSAWPNVFQDIVALGKLPADYAMMQTLDPKNKGLMGQALGEQKKNPDKTWDVRLGKDPQEPTRLLAVKIRDNVDSELTQFVTSLKASQASGDQIDQIVHGVQTLAFAKSYYDNDPTAAVDAVKAYTSQYDLGFSKARIPVSAAPVVKQNANNLLTHLPDWNIQYPQNIGQPGQPTKADYASWARSNPTWVTAPSGDRMWLVLPDGTRLKGPDDRPLGVMFTGKAYSSDIAPAGPSLEKPSFHNAILGSLSQDEFHSLDVGSKLKHMESLLA